MLPILFSVGPFTLYSYSIFIFAAAFFGLFVMWKRGNEFHFEQKDLFDAVFYVAFWVFVGARIGYVAIHALDFGLSVGDWLNVWGRPGWYYPVGLISGWIAMSRISSRLKWDVYQLADVLITGTVLAQAILALGAFVAGVGYGAPTNSFLGIQFSGIYDKRYPVQLWEFVGFTGLFIYLWWAEGVYRTFSWYRRNKSQAATGFLTSIYLIAWGLIKTVAALLRTPEMVVGFVRLDIVLPLVVAIVGGILLGKRSGFMPGSLWSWFTDYFGLSKN